MFEGLKTATDGVKALVTMKDKIETMQDIMPLLDAINSAHHDATKALSEIHALTMEKHALEKEVASLKAAGDKRAPYNLIEFSTGQVAWQRKGNTSNAYPYICAPCLETDVVTPLQPTSEGRFLNCDKCKALVETRGEGQSTSDSTLSGRTYC